MKLRANKTVLFAVVLAVMLPLAGCSLPLSEDNPDVDEDELQASAIETMDNVSTASMESEITMESDGSTIIEMELDGVANFDEQTARFETAIEQMGTSLNAEQYVIEDTVYMNADALGGWVKQDVSAQTGFQGGDLDNQQRILEESEIEVTGETTTDGHEVYIAEMDVDEEVMNEILEEQLGGDQMSGVQSDIEMSDVSVTQHIDVETNHVRYMQMEYTVSGPGQEISVVFEQRLSDFGQSVDITLPEEAEDAPPIDERSGF